MNRQAEDEKKPVDVGPGFESGAFESLESDFQEVRRKLLRLRRPVILRVYTSLLVPAAGCGRFWAGLVALENNENSKGSFFELSGPT